MGAPSRDATIAVSGKGERTRERLIAAAADLLHGQGVNATSTGEMMRASATGKGQFYQHFTSREALVHEVFARHAEFIRSQPAIASWDDLERWMLLHLEAQASYGFRRGCPIGTAAYALQADQDELRLVIAEAFSAMRANIARFLRGERLSTEASPDHLADFVIAAVQGGLLLALLYREERPLRRAIDEALAHLRSLVIAPLENEDQG